MRKKKKTNKSLNRNQIVWTRLYYSSEFSNYMAQQFQHSFIHKFICTFNYHSEGVQLDRLSSIGSCLIFAKCINRKS